MEMTLIPAGRRRSLPSTFSVRGAEPVVLTIAGNGVEVRRVSYCNYHDEDALSSTKSWQHMLWRLTTTAMQRLSCGNASRYGTVAPPS